MDERRDWFPSAEFRLASQRALGVLLLLATFTATISWAQQTSKSVRKHRVADDPSFSPAVAKAEAAIERKEYAAAEGLLKDAVAKDPKNYRAWFNLGFIYNATERTSNAIDAYRKSVDANPKIFESNLNLGILLARAGDAEAERYLRAATELKPSAQATEGHARAWLSLGHVLEKKNPKEALAALERAAQLEPKNVEPHLLAGMLAERLEDWPVAEKHYREAAELEPSFSEPLAGLINVYMRSGRLPEAEAALRTFLKSDPDNSGARRQLGRVLAAQGKTEQAVIELEAGLKGSEDVQARRDLARLYLEAKQYDKAAEQLTRLVAQDSNNPELRRMLGTSLLKQRRFPEAQQELLSALKLKPDLAEAYGDLAIAASENKDYALAIRALDARSKLLPEVPGTYFLRATAYDHLRDHEHAVENYKKFLAVANGQFPDQEWQARHRIKAIEPKR